MVCDQPYSALNPFSKYLYDSVFYESSRKPAGFEYAEFNYNSDGVKVGGYACLPKDYTASKLPVIIYNRGGTGNFSKLTKAILPHFYEIARNGFIVIGTNYRFVGEQGKYDELGGADVDDVINLYQLVIQQSYVDTSNVFMMGVSRGGLMTYCAAKKLKLNAVAVFSGVANSKRQYEYRPIFVEGWNDSPPGLNYLGLRQVLPDYEANKAAYLYERSPTMWAKDIQCPVLILHSRQDGFVKVGQALEMAQALEQANKAYQIKIYDQKSHALPSRDFDSVDETIHWFKQHIN